MRKKNVEDAEANNDKEVHESNHYKLLFSRADCDVIRPCLEELANVGTSRELLINAYQNQQVRKPRRLLRATP